MSWPMASTLSSSSEAALNSFLRKFRNGKFTKPVLLSMMPAVHEILGDAATGEFVELVQSELHDMFELSRKNGGQGVKKKDASDVADAFQQLDFDKVDRGLGKGRKKRGKKALKKAKKTTQNGDKDLKEERRSNRIRECRVDPLYVDLQSGSSAEDERLFCSFNKTKKDSKMRRESQRELADDDEKSSEEEKKDETVEAPEKETHESSFSVMELDAESRTTHIKDAESLTTPIKCVEVSFGEEESPATTLELETGRQKGSEGEKKEETEDEEITVVYESVSEVKERSGIVKSSQLLEKACELITIDSNSDNESGKRSPVSVKDIKVETANKEDNPMETKETVFIKNQRKNEPIFLTEDSIGPDSANQASGVVFASPESSDREDERRLGKKKRKRKVHSRVAALKSGKLSMVPVVKLRRMLLPSKYMDLELLVKDEKAEENKSKTEVGSSNFEASEKCVLNTSNKLKKDEISDEPKSEWSKLNSDDDVSDQSDEEMKASLEDAEAVIVCVFDKIRRKRITCQKTVSWKLHLRNGILMHEGRELFFDLALGKANFS